MHCVLLAVLFTRPATGTKIDKRMPRIAITTMSSIRVNPARFIRS